MVAKLVISGVIGALSVGQLIRMDKKQKRYDAEKRKDEADIIDLVIKDVEKGKNGEIKVEVYGL